MAKKIGKSQTLVAQYIARLNRVDKCVTKVSNGKYKLNYSDIDTRGIFLIIRKSITTVMMNAEEYTSMVRKERAKYLNVEETLIPVIEAYIFMEPL